MNAYAMRKLVYEESPSFTKKARYWITSSKSNLRDSATENNGIYMQR